MAVNGTRQRRVRTPRTHATHWHAFGARAHGLSEIAGAGGQTPVAGRRRARVATVSVVRSTCAQEHTLTHTHSLTRIVASRVGHGHTTKKKPPSVANKKTLRACVRMHMCTDCARYICRCKRALELAPASFAGPDQRALAWWHDLRALGAVDRSGGERVGG